MAQATFTTPQDQQAESFTLLSGHTIPAVGLGTWKSGSKASESVFTAIVEVCFTIILLGMPLMSVL
jgi:alcohol dehydrogenase (NADP+)